MSELVRTARIPMALDPDPVALSVAAKPRSRRARWRDPARPARGVIGAPAALLVAIAALSAPAAALELSPQERAGKRIYLRGESPSGGEISALLGRDDLALPATSLPCGSCHGEDGLGRAEGGARPPAILWSELVKPYGHVHPGGRKHPRYDARSFARTVTEGVDPAGNALDPTMPRYRMSAADLASLAAYLRRLERDRDPGVGEGELRVGTLLPAAGPAADAGRAMRAALEARLAEVNAAGGVNGRRVRLVVEGYDPAGGAAAAAAGARRLVERGQVLALVSGLFPSAEPEVFELAARAEIPLIGPFTLFASQPGSPNPWVFHLLSGVREQARALAEFAADRLAPERPPVAVVSPADPRLADAAAAAKAQLGRRGFAAVEPVAYEPPLPPSVARDLAEKGVRAVVFLGEDADLARLAAGAQDAGWAPDLLLPGALVARAALEVPPSLDGHVFLAYPTLPTDEKAEGRARLAALAARGVSGHRAAVIQADGAAAVLVEALRRTGRGVSRRALVASLEALYQLDSGLLPPLTFGPSRRVGALGAWLVAVDVKDRTLRPVGGWQGVE